jgi:hypothetical protein
VLSQGTLSYIDRATIPTIENYLPTLIFQHIFDTIRPPTNSNNFSQEHFNLATQNWCPLTTDKCYITMNATPWKPESKRYSQILPQ